MTIFESADPKFGANLKAAIEAANATGDVANVVSDILGAIRARGDEAVLEFTHKFDRADLTAPDQRVAPEALESALQDLPADQRTAIESAKGCIEDFHRKTLPKSWRATNAHGAIVGEQFYPIQRVGLYIPGGQVPLVSSVLMSAVLAQIAGVPQVVVCTPPREDGTIDPGLLGAIALCGISEVYKIGGVQAIGALAYGTATVPPVDKIFGPGNAFVMEAKRQVYGTVGVDLLPGPSEVMIIADDTANPVYVAADILAQAEHGTGKEKIFVSVPSLEFWKIVESEVEGQTPHLSHAEAIGKVLEKHLFVVVAGTVESMVEAANIIAPEHLELQVSGDKDEELTTKITTAGAMLIGHDTPTVLGDFTAGPSHTLPTGRTGRFFSGMQVYDFMRRSSIVKYNADSIAKAWPTVKAFSEMERLDAHGNSLRLRVENYQ